MMLPIDDVSAGAHHEPISIQGNAGFTNDSGVVWGLGTPEDPYVIAGWDIDMLGPSGAAIHINNTTADFVVRDISLASLGSGTGIFLEQVTNGTLQSVSVGRFACGIRLDDCNDSSILSCSVSDSTDQGIWLESSNNLTVERCILVNNTYGIDDSLDVHHGWPKFFRLNEFRGNDVGMRVSTSNAEIMDNSFFDNGVGLQFGGGWEIVTGNFFSNSTSYAIEILAGSPSHSIWNNSFFDNNGAGAVYDPSHIQAYDDGTNVNWDVGGYGNFWSDWQTPDDDHDGIVDVPYELADNPVHPVAGADNYPLTVPTVIPEFPGTLLVVVLYLIALLSLAFVTRLRT